MQGAGSGDQWCFGNVSNKLFAIERPQLSVRVTLGEEKEWALRKSWLYLASRTGRET
jgi:hypothetical protein